MKKFLSIAVITAGIASLVYAVLSIFKLKKNNEEMDDLVYSDEFDEFDEEGSYFDVNLKEDDEEENNMQSEEEN